MTEPQPQPYPSVVGEFATLDELLRGKSIARLGDGELKLIDGKGYFRELANELLGAELLSIVREPDESCLVGIPTWDPNGPKYENWMRHFDRFQKILSPDVQYYSAFITRPDSAPWINTIEFAQKMESLWRKKRVAILSEPDNKILTAVGLAAKKITHVVCPHREAYAQIDQFEKEIAGARRKRPEIALLSCGPTATCLANRLAGRGIQAIDIGSAGGYLLKLLLGK
jgi:hypothetical protein